MSDDTQPSPTSSPVPPPDPDSASVPPPSPPAGGLPIQSSPNSARGWEVACHLAGFSGYLTGVGWILGPLIVWLLKRAEMPSVDVHGKEALNFQISILIYGLVLLVSGFLTCGIGFFLLIPLGIAQIVLMILGAIKAANGEIYRYPLTIRLVN